MKQALSTALVALVCGFAGAAAWSFSGLGDTRLRGWLVANADVLPAMADALRKEEAQARLAELGDEVARPFPGATLGNPRGSRTLVEFTDYGCGYCRSSEQDVRRLIAGDPELKVVIREWPLFDGSEEAARMALAAAEQGKYAAFHRAMFAHGDTTPAAVARAAAAAGLDVARAKAFAASDRVTAELANNMQLAQALGFRGTPAWIAQGRIVEGAAGYDRLKAAIDGKGEV